MRDILYYYDKVSGYEYELGEIQSDFNMSFVIDGTKDSAKVICWSYGREKAVEPYTIIRHNNTNTWWIVSHDKVERYENEIGYKCLHIFTGGNASKILKDIKAPYIYDENLCLEGLSIYVNKR